MAGAEDIGHASYIHRSFDACQAIATSKPGSLISVYPAEVVSGGRRDPPCLPHNGAITIAGIFKIARLPLSLLPIKTLLGWVARQERLAMSESRFELGGYIAEVLQAKCGGNSWYYAIQTQTGEIVSIERFDVYEEARDEALRALSRLNRATAAGE